jgi:hypothetical protein
VCVCPPVTWESSTGQVVLYDNGRPMWTVTRGKGKRIPSGGTLVIGREQVSGFALAGVKSMLGLRKEMVEAGFLQQLLCNTGLRVLHFCRLTHALR